MSANRICKCCGGPLEPTQMFICVTCLTRDDLPDSDDSEPEHPQAGWKGDVANDERETRKISE